MPESIEKEIEAGAGESPSRRWSRVLNNFHLNFELGTRPYDPATRGALLGGGYRQLALEQGLLSTVRREFQGEEVAGHSDLWLDQTFSEFYEAIDAAIVELGISKDDISVAVNKVVLGPRLQGEAREALIQTLWDLTAPVYVALRKKGYTRTDLRQ